MIRVKVAGQVASVQQKKSTKGKDYQDIQILQKNPANGRVSIVNGRLWNGVKVEVGKMLEIEGLISAFKFKSGEVGLAFDVY